MADGCTIGQASISGSIVGLRSQIADGVQMRDTILMGADYYEMDPSGEVPLGLGKDCSVAGAILDKNVRLGPGVEIRPFPAGADLDSDDGDWVVRDGIVVVPKNTVIPAGAYIGPE